VIPTRAGVSAPGDSPDPSVTFPAVRASTVLTVVRLVRPVIQVTVRATTEVGHASAPQGSLDLCVASPVR